MAAAAGAVAVGVARGDLAAAGAVIALAVAGVAVAAGAAVSVAGAHAAVGVVTAPAVAGVAIPATQAVDAGVVTLRYRMIAVAVQAVTAAVPYRHAMAATPAAMLSIAMHPHGPLRQVSLQLLPLFVLV